MAKEGIEDVLSSTSKLASYNVILQFSFRAVTFLLNAFTLRYISKDALGVVNVRLVLLYSTILFLSREAFRRACLSKSPTKPGEKQYTTEWRKMMNLLWCILPVGIVFTSLLSYVWIYYLRRPDPESVPHYTLAVCAFGSSVVIELVAEPLFIMAQALLFVKLRVLSEGVPMVFKCIVTVILVIWFPSLGILTFAIAQIMFSVTYVIIMYSYFTWYIISGCYKNYEAFPFSSSMQYFPSFANFIDWDSATLVWSFFKQSLLKQFLTEGEKYVMTFFNILSFGDQGVYDVVNNLGSLAARFIFLPIEESFYIFFAKMLDRGKPIKKQDEEKMKLVQYVLFCLLRLVTLVGLIILTFGYSFSFLVLHLYGGSLLSEGSGPTLLRLYSLYVLLIAINGTTECFFFAAMSQAEVDRYNKKMLGFSLGFLASSYYLTWYLGSIGFILANCLNMVIRIAHSMRFIHRLFKNNSDSPLAGLTPHWMVLQSFGIVFAICGFSETFFKELSFYYFAIGHISVGFLCLTSLLAVLYITEEKLVMFLEDQFLKGKKKRQ